jgi:hypothetical protein
VPGAEHTAVPVIHAIDRGVVLIVRSQRHEAKLAAWHHPGRRAGESSRAAMD